MNGQTVSHLLIDNAIGTKLIVRGCITQNTLRSLLNMSKISNPIEVRFTHVNKTEKMRMVDEILKDRYEIGMKTREETWEAMSQKIDQPRLVEKLFHPAKLISVFEDQLGRIKQDLSFFRPRLLASAVQGYLRTSPGMVQPDTGCQADGVSTT